MENLWEQIPYVYFIVFAFLPTVYELQYIITERRGNYQKTLVNLFLPVTY